MSTREEDLVQDIRNKATLDVPKSDKIGFFDELRGDAVEFKDLPSSYFSSEIVNDFATADQNRAISLGYGVSLDNNAIADIIKEQFPNVVYTNDKYNNLIATIPRYENNVPVEPYKFYVNPRGAQGVDFAQLAAQTLQFIPFMRVGAGTLKGANMAQQFKELATKGLKLFGAGAGLDVTQQSVAGALGSEQGTVNYGPIKFDPIQSAIVGGITPFGAMLGYYGSKATGAGVERFLKYKRDYFPKYFDRKTNVVNEDGAVELSKIGIKFSQDKDSSFFTDPKGVIYKPDDKILTDTLIAIEKGIPAENAWLHARAESLGIPLMGFQVRGKTKTSTIMSQSEDETLFNDFLNGRYGGEAQEIAMQVKGLQEENALRAFAKTIGIEDEDAIKGLMNTLIDPKAGGHTTLVDALGAFTATNLKNQKEGLESQIAQQYTKFQDDRLQVLPAEWEKLGYNMDNHIKAITGLPSNSANLKKTSPYLLRAHEMNQTFIKDMHGKGGNFVKGFDLKAIMNHRTKMQQLYNKVPKDKPQQAAEVLSYFNKVDENIDGMFNAMLTKPTSNFTKQTYKDLMDARAMFRELHVKFGKNQTYNMGILEKIDDQFISRIVNQKDISPMEIGFWFQNNKNIGLDDRVIGTINKIRDIFKDDPNTLLNFNNLLKKSLLSEMAFTSVVKEGSEVSAGAVIDSRLLSNATQKWFKTSSGKKIWNNVFGEESASTKQKLETLIEVLDSTKNKTKIPVRTADTGSTLGSTLFTQGGAVNDVLQLMSYKHAGLEGLYAYKVLTRDISKGVNPDFDIIELSNNNLPLLDLFKSTGFSTIQKGREYLSGEGEGQYDSSIMEQETGMGVNINKLEKALDDLQKVR
tara:strand:- start:11268 stop:13847 length:2580 start_codon:yes stop_codon:yes gene_type:complete